MSMNRKFGNTIFRPKPSRNKYFFKMSSTKFETLIMFWFLNEIKKKIIRKKKIQRKRKDLILLNRNLTQNKLNLAQFWLIFEMSLF